MTRSRRSGVLLHPTSLPGRFGIGDLGPEAIELLDWMRAAGQTVWQMLPLGPTGLGSSPYTSRSAFAGNPLLISPERLAGDGLLPADALVDVPEFPAERVDYPRVIEWKDDLLRRSWRHVKEARAPEPRLEALEDFLAAGANRPWLADWTLFAAISRRQGDSSWQSWPRAERLRAGERLEALGVELAEEVAYQGYLQYLFFDQWERVHAAAAERGISILGDLPIYVGLDSADVWAHRELFDLDADGRPLSLAGVPPDDFTESGQLWGHPLYDWQRHAETGYAWWIDRLRASFLTVDAVRVDHFRGFAGYWRIPVGAENAATGEWVDGPGVALFNALSAALPELTLIAEDLGLITDDVHELRRTLGIPGMRVLQFGYGEADSIHRAENVAADTVLYTGTHDNPPVVAWFDSLETGERESVLRAAGGDGRSIHWRLIELALGSSAETVVIPIQDVLGLGDEARMNLPGEAEGNWEWRLAGAPDSGEADRLRALVESSVRLPGASS